MTSLTSVASSSWPEIIRRIPGYDPYRDAGDCTFDEERAQNVVDFFSECLTHVKGDFAGKPLVMEVWQRAVLGNIFGWLRPDGTRRYREVFIYVPRKQGKSIITAGIGLFLLFCDGEPGAEIYAAAAEREQAAILFNVAKQMVIAEPTLLGAAEVYQRAIVLKGSTSSFKVVSADAKKKHGYNPHGVIIDELHAVDNRELIDALTTGSGARRQPLIVYLSTADFARPSPCNEKLDYAKRVRDGRARVAEFLPVIYEATLEDDWKDPAVWARVNPCLGISIPVDYFVKECQKAQDQPTYENTFKRLHLNIRTQQDKRFIQIDEWMKCATPLDERELLGMKCYAGLDLSSTKDVSAFVMIFKLPGDKFAVVPRFWVPGENAHKRERRDKVAYLTWARQWEDWKESDGKRGKPTGLELTDGNVIDYDLIKERILALAKIYDIQEIASDRWGATQILTQLAGEGLEVVAYGQGFKDMTAPTRHLDLLITSHRIVHGGNEVLTWMAGNVAVEEDAAGNVKPSKKKSPEKIDGILGLVMGLGRWLVSVPVKKRGYTKDRGLGGAKPQEQIQSESAESAEPEPEQEPPAS